MLEVGDGHRLYWESCGNPRGKPAVVLHGGPGSGCTPGWRRFFDPRAYRVVLFDQRGCGRSLPHASDPATGLATNTTSHLVADIERLRRAMGVEHWLVLGGSWGATLAQAYAEQHAERISEMVLFSVTATSRREIEWITRHVGRFFPAAWERFRDGVPSRERSGSLVDAYARLLGDSDPAIREQAAADWCAWEDAHVALTADHSPDPRYADPRFRMAFARLVTHYWRHAAWLPDGLVGRAGAALAATPGVLVHGRLDLGSPPDIAWALARAWPGSELTLVDHAGHGAGQDAIGELVVRATDRFAHGS
jgi:proline iminopeptidase